MKKRILSTILTLLLIVGLMSIISIPALAQTITVSTLTQLQRVLLSATKGDVIALTQDIVFVGGTPIGIPSGKDITITSSGNNNFTIKMTNTTNSRHIYVDSGATLRLENITLDGGFDGSGSYRGGIENYGNLTLNDGAVIKNCSAADWGGGIYCLRNSTLNVNGGVISGNTAEYGGGICSNPYSTVNVSGGEICGNSATYYGGGICSDISGTVDVSGGEICGNWARDGGGIYMCTYCTLNVSGGVISGNWARDGGGIFNCGTLTVSSDEISGNTATSDGGGIYIYDGIVTVSGVVISGNTADHGGGICNKSYGALNVSGGEISGNTATSDGGGIYCPKKGSATNTGTLTVSGVVISGNTAAGYGGGIYFEDFTKLSVVDTVFSGSTASQAYWMTDPADIDTYNAQIKGVTSFSDPPEGQKPFEYAYNNYDIGYTKGLTSNPMFVIYSITFVDWDGSIIDLQEVGEGEAAVAPPDPARTGYTFTGWDVDFSNVTGDLTVTAQYSINTYTVSFYVDGEQYDTQIVDYGSAAIDPNPTKEGHFFSGWDVDFFNITADLDVYGIFTKNTYTVNFYVDDELFDIQIVNYGNAAAEPNPVKNGYTFSGWDVDFSFITGDLDVYGTFTINTYTVRFVDWDGALLGMPQPVTHGSAAIAPPDPARTGYTFTGWDVDFSNVTGDLTVTARYAQIWPDSVSLDVTEVRLQPGETQQLTETVQPFDALNSSVVWTSVDATVATVSAVGLVTAVAPGWTVITVTTANGLTATCVVTVPSVEILSEELGAALESGFELGMFGNNGSFQSISSSLKNAEKQLEMGKIDNAIKQYQNIIDALRKDAGQGKIDAAYADEMIAMVETIIERLRV